MMKVLAKGFKAATATAEVVDVGLDTILAIKSFWNR